MITSPLEAKEPTGLPDIAGFTGEYAFLSNFYPATIVHDDGVTYPTAEHAYQAQKTTNPTTKQKIASLPYPGAAKRYGAKLPLTEEWSWERYTVMDRVLMLKFQDPVLQKRLLDTENARLVETNFWGDVYWGVCNGTGANVLGTLLMSIRARMQLILAQPMTQPIVGFGNPKDIISLELKP